MGTMLPTFAFLPRIRHWSEKTIIRRESPDRIEPIWLRRYQGACTQCAELAKSDSIGQC
jgi:hypothetical protein